MNLIFLTMSQFDDLDVHNIYSDLLREFIAHGHKPFLVSPIEAQSGGDTAFIDRGDYAVLRVKVGDTSNVSLIKKGISTVLMEGCFITAIKKHLSKFKFDLILYSTPPVTFAKVIKYLKKKNGAATYLLLKDIFPQNAVDLGMFGQSSPIYKFFRSKEKTLYALSDQIGCMSQANVDYLLTHNPHIAPQKVHISPNSIELLPVSKTADERAVQREKYGIPQDSVVFIYGGNMGKPQDIPFVIRCLRAAADRSDFFFIMCGTGSDYCLLEKYMDEERQANLLLINGLPKKDYDALLKACDVGLIFLDHRFTIPNFPSRLLSYMEYSMPVLACTDPNTDVGKVITDGGFGWWCESDDPEKFPKALEGIAFDGLAEMGQAANQYLEQQYTASKSYDIIVSKVSF